MCDVNSDPNLSVIKHLSRIVSTSVSECVYINFEVASILSANSLITGKFILKCKLEKDLVTSGLYFSPASLSNASENTLLTTSRIPSLTPLSIAWSIKNFSTRESPIFNSCSFLYGTPINVSPSPA